MYSSDIIVIGGGLVGTAVAYGLASSGAKVRVLDEGDDGFRASRGNFGLVWVQGKGYGFTPYARWTRQSAAMWPTLAQKLLSETGIDVQLQQPGGFAFCLSEEEFQDRGKRMESIRDALGGDYPFEMLDHASLKKHLPEIGPEVAGASYTPMDGHVNPLKLFRALHAGCRHQDVNVHTRQSVENIRFDDGLFTVNGKNGTFQAPKVVLAAGLGNNRLAPMVGLHAPVQPNRGQVLISERIRHFLDYPTINVRQTDEGTIQLGDSMEEVGFDDTTTTDVIAAIARRAVASFPVLGKVNLVRAWGALRVMTPDGFPIYQQSRTCPGAFVTTCHSGVTLAAAHAFRVAPWIAGGAAPDEIDVFAGDRFLNPDRNFSHAH
ncbi:NAD(P)/FAD-dependent oxidoreductase [Herbaspirillum sp. GCM10030257]|uniref:NAD(P)/FAD-dependent oxidoreductase n=1 Tax=Herbaspirillum sp. GCM10030257 TaxID=3273393 RepID=UPI003614461F